MAHNYGGYVCGIVTIVCVITGIVVLAVSFQKLQSDQVGLKYDSYQCKLKSEPIGEGLHTGPPGFKFIIFPAVERSFEFTDQMCLNLDGVTTKLFVRFQYSINREQLYDIVTQFRNFDRFQQILRTIGESAIIDTCSLFNTSRLQEDRGSFQEMMKDRLTEKYAGIDATVSNVQVNDIVRPAEYENAVKEKQKALEDIEVAKNERPLAITEAETVKIESETEAQITIAKAKSDSRIIVNRAASDAQGIMDEYVQESKTYKKLKDQLGMSPEGMLSYIGVRTIQNAKHDLVAGIDAPAKSSWITP